MADTAAAGALRQDVEVVGLVSSGHFMSHYYTMMLPPLFPFLHDELGVSYAALGLLLSLKHISAGTVQLPAVLPALVSGLRLGMAQAWLFLVASELLGAAMGLGFLLTISQQTGRVDRILLTIVLLALLGALSNAILSVVQKRLLRRWA